MRFLPLLFSVAYAALLSGCQTGGQTAYVSPYDTEAMARVERAAQSTGVKVIWLHPPAKKAKAD